MEIDMENNNSISIAEQNRTDYQFTEAEQKLLDVLLNPDYRMKSIKEICAIAAIGRTTYYAAFKKPEFQALYKSQSRALVDQSIAPVLNTFVREALRGSFQHGKVILEMAGLYSEKSTVEVTGELLLSAEDRRARIAELLQKPVIEGIKAEYKALPEPDQGEE
jgi:hypothetical protein